MYQVEILSLKIIKIGGIMNTVRILSIDGGGIRGIIPLKVLEYIENKINRPIHEVFNIMGGTSTGGIIALGLNSKSPTTNRIYTTQEVLKFYTKDAHRIFHKKDMWDMIKDHGPGITSPKYSGTHVEDYFKEKFGKDTKMIDLPEDACTVMVFSYDITRDDPVVFSNLAFDVDYPYYVWQAARATSAAPTYFPAAKFGNEETFIDGGVYINNPALDLLSAAKQLYPEDNYMLISIGTGDFRQSRADLAGKGAIGWLKNGDLLDIMMNGVSVSVDQQLGNLLTTFLPESNHRYERYQKRFDTNVDMDNIRPKNIELLQKLGEELVNENQDRLDELCHILNTSEKPQITGNEHE